MWYGCTGIQQCVARQHGHKMLLEKITFTFTLQWEEARLQISETVFYVKQRLHKVPEM